MNRTLVHAILGIALMATIPAQGAAQTQDTTAPVLTGFDFTPKTVDTTLGPASWTVTISATDDLAGVIFFWIWFNSPSGEHFAGVNVYCQGTSCTGSEQFGLPQYSEPGVWTAGGAYGYDVIGNVRTYNTAALAGMGFPTELRNTHVQYSFTGFFPPVDNPPTYNKTKALSAIPVKFSLGGDMGTDIFAPGYPQSVNVPCTGGALQAAVEETLTAGSSSLSYDAASGQYVYIWKTERNWAGTCRQLVLRLSDGSEFRASFTFTR